MSTPIGVGLHILYGRMGAGKTNYAVNVLLRNTTYKKVVLNVPLTPEFKETFVDTEFVEFKKLEPEKVIRLIDESHQDTFFVIDESQMVLMSANKLLVDSFCKKMSQIRQNNQCVIVIAQISSMLPKDIKLLAESCFFFENNNVKGIEKSSKVKHYRTGFDYTTRLIETFTYTHVYGNYESTNTPTTEKPQNLYKRTYIKIALFFGFALILFIFGGIQFYRFITRDSDKVESKTFVQNSVDKLTNFQQTNNDTLCVRSYVVFSKQLMYVVYNDGSLMYIPISDFVKANKCHL